MRLYTSNQWKTLCRQRLKASKILFNAGYYRDSVNRSYYAAFAVATAICVEHGDAVNFPSGWNNPTHEQLPLLMCQNGNLAKTTRQNIGKILRFLRSAREDADYRPGIAVGKSTALDCLRQLTTILRLLGINENDSINSN
ncbi:MAG: HEPN domain-containing protein [Chthonomonadaceae bacterium]|nr:HEPN domain-containing protein [Chthonomonadaceae bacterium]